MDFSGQKDIGSLLGNSASQGRFQAEMAMVTLHHHLMVWGFIPLQLVAPCVTAVVWVSLPAPSVLSVILIGLPLFVLTGNCGCAFLQIDVGRSSWPLDRPFVTLLPATMLMSRTDSKSGKNRSGVRMFKDGKEGKSRKADAV